MKHLISYKIYEVRSDLPKNHDGKPIYPYDKLEKIIEKFQQYFQKNMDDEGWYVGITDEDYFADDYDTSDCAGDVFVISSNLTHKLSFTEAEECAKKYGFITDKHGVIYDFDDDVFSKFKYKISGVDLNLLESNIKHLNKYKIFEATISDSSIATILFKIIEHIDEKNESELNIAKELIENSTNINAINQYEETALHIAVMKQKEKIVQMLIDKGADVNMKDQNGSTPIFYSSNNYDIIKSLINAGADINMDESFNRNPMIIYSVYQKHFDVLKLLVDSGADVNKLNHEGSTALMVACANNFKAALTFLLKAGTNLTIRNNYGKNFIDLCHSKVWISDYDTQQYILSKEPSLYKSLIDNKIPIHNKIKKEFPHLISGTDLSLL